MSEIYRNYTKTSKIRINLRKVLHLDIVTVSLHSASVTINGETFPIDMRNIIEISMTVQHSEENVHRPKRRKITDWLIPQSHQNDVSATSSTNSIRTRSKTKSSHQADGLATSTAPNEDDVSIVPLRKNLKLPLSKTNSSNIAGSNLNENQTDSNTISNLNEIQTDSNTISNFTDNKELQVKLTRLSRETLRKYMGNRNGEVPNTHLKPTSHSKSKNDTTINRDVRSTIRTRSRAKAMFSDGTHPCDSNPAIENILEAEIADNSRDVVSNQTEAISNTNESNPIRIIAQQQFRISEIVWAKLGHFPSWPCKIERLYGVRNQMVEVLWFNDFRRSKMHIANIYKFFDKFQEFSKDADIHVGLNRAIKEAIIYETSRRFNR